MQHKSFALSVKQLGETGTFQGILSTYGNQDLQGDVCDPGCFTKSLQEAGGKITLLWQHDMSRPIGALKLTDSQQGLLAEGTLNMALQDAREAHSTMLFNLTQGLKTGMSIGFLTVKEAYVSGVRHLKELMLLEGSLVTFPANPMAGVTAAKSASQEIDFTAEEFRKFLDEVFGKVDIYGGRR